MDQKNVLSTNFWSKEDCPKTNEGLQKLRAPKKLGSKSLVKKRLLREEILLTWTNMPVPGNMLPLQNSQFQLESLLDVPRNLPLEFGQNRAGNS